jgi:hypothetical protein
MFVLSGVEIVQGLLVEGIAIFMAVGVGRPRVLESKDV